MATRPLSRWLWIVCAAFALTACGRSSSSSDPPAPPAPPPPPPPPPPPTVPTLGVERAFPNLTLTHPVGILQAPSDNSRWFVVQQDGRVQSFENRTDVATTSLMLDIQARVISDHVQGMLGMAFHPGFPSDPRAYLAYTSEVTPGNVVLRISEFTTADNGVTLNPSSEQILFAITQPGGHNNGGHLLFGPDGFLYAAVGDGGNDDAPSGVVGNGQMLTTLLGKLLRVDVGGTTGARRYRIPSDNPFAANPLCNLDGSGTQNCPEIYAWGLRNPWRWSFDRQGGALWLGNVGSSQREEVDRLTKGGNYGWRCFEGTRNTGITCGSPPQDQLQAPIAEYDHTLGIAVSGGYVYRGTAMPGLAGRFVFGDYGSGRIWNIATDTAPTKTMTAAEAASTGLAIASFAEEQNGEILVVDRSAGGVHRVIAAP